MNSASGSHLEQLHWGGLLMVFFGTAVLMQFNILPQEYAEAVEVIQGANLLRRFHCISDHRLILSLDRKILLQSFAGYIPAILGGLACAVLFGVIAGAIFGISPTNIIISTRCPLWAAEMEQEPCLCPRFTKGPPGTCGQLLLPRHHYPATIVM